MGRKREGARGREEETEGEREQCGMGSRKEGVKEEEGERVGVRGRREAIGREKELRKIRCQMLKHSQH